MTVGMMLGLALLTRTTVSTGALQIDAALVLFGRREGGGRFAGFFLIALYVVFVVVQLTVLT